MQMGKIDKIKRCWKILDQEKGSCPPLPDKDQSKTQDWCRHLRARVCYSNSQMGGLFSQGTGACPLSERPFDIVDDKPNNKQDPLQESRSNRELPRTCAQTKRTSKCYSSWIYTLYFQCGFIFWVCVAISMLYFFDCIAKTLRSHIHLKALLGNLYRFSFCILLACISKNRSI